MAEDSTPSAKTIEVYADTVGQGRCKGPHCRRVITWAVVVDSGAKMCFEGLPRAVATREDLTGREILAMPFEENHWATCPDREQFQR